MSSARQAVLVHEHSVPDEVIKPSFFSRGSLCYEWGQRRIDMKTHTCFEEKVAKHIIGCVGTTNGRLGRRKVAGILCGSLAGYVFKDRYNETPYFGSLKMFKREQVVGLLDILIAKGHIDILDEDFPSIELTESGRAIQKGEETTRVPMPWDLSPEIVPTPADMDLFQLIRRIRAEIAVRDDMPAYCVFGNRTLLELSMLVPTKKEELYDIYGLNTVKVEKYGDHITLAINDYLESKKEEMKAKVAAEA